MKAVKSFFNWIYLGLVFFRYVFGGIIRLPFGRAGDYYRSISGSFGRHMMKAVGGSYTYEGLEGLDPSKSYIFVGNHQSYADIFLIFLSLDSQNIRTLFMVKRELLKIPLFGTVAKHMGLIPVARGESREALKAMVDAVKMLDKGNSLTIFPEGTRTRDGEIGTFKKGSFILSTRTGLPVVPFVITGTSDIMSAVDLHIHRGKTGHITFLPPVDPAEMSAKELSDTVEAQIRSKYELLRKDAALPA